MATLKYNNTNEEVELPDDSPIQEACEEAGVPFACTEGVCGTCIIEVLDGMEHLSPPTAAEIDFLGEHGVRKERMACQCRIKKGVVRISF